jgi:hypothetical protein
VTVGCAVLGDSSERHLLPVTDSGRLWQFMYVSFAVRRVVTGNKNSPTVTHACRKRRLKWVATLPLGDINTEA